MKEKIIKEFQDMVSSSEMITDYWLEKKLDQYAVWYLKECLPEKGGYACWECGSDGWNACIDQILLNKDKK